MMPKPKNDHEIVTTSVRIPRWMNRMVELDAARKDVGKSDIFQMALKKWFKIVESTGNYAVTPYGGYRP